ncbi:hypothetical protein [Reyranella soli]|nr:hypothetical protein [Reyranella soli]
MTNYLESTGTNGIGIVGWGKRLRLIASAAFASSPAAATFPAW